MEDKGVSIISYDRLIDTEKRLLDMQDKGVGLYYYRNDERIKNAYDIGLENKQLEHDNIGTDNVLFLGDEEREYGNYGFYSDMLKHEEGLSTDNAILNT